MEIKRDFDQFKKIMKQGSRARLLVSGSQSAEVKTISGIEVLQDAVNCTYHFDNRYSYHLRFERTFQGTINMKVTLPGLFVILGIGIFLGFKFIDEFGYLGIIVGVALFYGISQVVRFFVARGIRRRIERQWELALA